EALAGASQVAACFLQDSFEQRSLDNCYQPCVKIGFSSRDQTVDQRIQIRSLGLRWSGGMKYVLTVKRWQKLGEQQRAGRPQHCLLEDGLHLADIARPVVLPERREGFGVEALNVESQFLVEEEHEMMRQLGNVVGPFPQRGHTYRDAAQAI